MNLVARAARAGWGQSGRHRRTSEFPRSRESSGSSPTCRTMVDPAEPGARRLVSSSVEDEAPLAESRPLLPRSGGLFGPGGGTTAVEPSNGSTRPRGAGVLDPMLPEVSGLDVGRLILQESDGPDHHGDGQGFRGGQGHRARARCGRLRDEAVLGVRARLWRPCAPSACGDGVSSGPRRAPQWVGRSRWMSPRHEVPSAASRWVPTEGVRAPRGLPSCARTVCSPD